MQLNISVSLPQFLMVSLCRLYLSVFAILLSDAAQYLGISVTVRRLGGCSARGSGVGSDPAGAPRPAARARTALCPPVVTACAGGDTLRRRRHRRRHRQHRRHRRPSSHRQHRRARRSEGAGTGGTAGSLGGIGGSGTGGTVGSLGGTERSGICPVGVLVALELQARSEFNLE